MGRRMAVGLAAVAVLLWLFRDPVLRMGGRLIFPFPFRAAIERDATAAQVDPLLVVAVMREESGFVPEARSRAGAVGLMQLMPETARWVARKRHEPVGDLDQPADNIRLGAAYLGYLNHHFKGDVARILAAYNGGEGNVARWHRLSEAYPETRQYVERGLRTYSVYQWLYSDGRASAAVPASSFRP